MRQKVRANTGGLGMLGLLEDPRHRVGTEARSRDQLIPSLAALVEPFRECLRIEVFHTFQLLIAGWIVCLGPHTISEAWQATGLAAKRHSAAWEWVDLGMVLVTLILSHLVPGGVVWLVVDDRLCHKRGAKVAFGGIFLDAVLSSKKHKTLRFGLHWVVLGIAVPCLFARIATSACRCSGDSIARRGSPGIRVAPWPPPNWLASWPRRIPIGSSGWWETPPTSTRRC